MSQNYGVIIFLKFDQSERSQFFNQCVAVFYGHFLAGGGSKFGQFPTDGSRNKTLKKILSLPELLFKLVLSGFSKKLTTHSNFHYRMKAQCVLCGFSYRLLGMRRTIKLLKLSGCNE